MRGPTASAPYVVDHAGPGLPAPLRRSAEAPAGYCCHPGVTSERPSKRSIAVVIAANENGWAGYECFLWPNALTCVGEARSRCSTAHPRPEPTTPEQAAPTTPKLVDTL